MANPEKMTTQLVKYEAACRAIAECKSFDEVKSWVDKAAAMKAYSRMAQDKTLEVDAAEIRIRAERRLGEMILQQKAGAGLAKPGVKPKLNSVDVNDRIQTLAEVGIKKDLSSRAQVYASVPEAEFEAELAAKRERDKQEGVRVSSRLLAAGKRAMEQTADPVPYSDEGAPSIEELMASQEVADKELASMRRIFDADDKLAEALSIIKQRDALIEQLQWRINGLVNENAELISSVKSWRRRAEKAAA